MAEVIQNLIDENIGHGLEPWEKAGVEFEGIQVKKIPENLRFTLSRFKKIQELLQPEYKITGTSIKPNELTVSVVPEKVFREDIKGVSGFGQEIHGYITMKPQTGDLGYDGKANLYLHINNFPEDVPRILKLTASTGPHEDPQRSKSYKWKETKEQSRGLFYSSRLQSFVKDLKTDVKIALALREYEKVD